MPPDIGLEIAALAPKLQGIALKWTGSPDDAADLAQDAILRALERIDDYRPGTNLSAWVVTILKNKIHDRHRRAKNRRMVTIDDPERPVDDLPVEVASQEASVGHTDLARAFGTLSESDRVILLLVGADGVSYEEAARRLGVPCGTVKSRMCRARERLRTALEAA